MFFGGVCFLERLRREPRLALDNDCFGEEGPG